MAAAATARRLSPSRSNSQIETLADLEDSKRMQQQKTNTTSNNYGAPFTYPTSSNMAPSSSNSSSNSNGMLGEPVLMDRQGSSSRISLRPSYETLNTGLSSRSSTSLSMSPSSTTVNGSIINAAPSVAAIGKVNVTDPWGTAWGMDSPYDASVAYASNPNRITMRQSAYFGSGLTLAALAGGPPYTTTQHGNGTVGTTSAASASPGLHPNLATATSSPAPSSFSSISGSAASGNTNVWSEASSTNSTFSSSFNGNAPPSAPWTNDGNVSHHGKRRSVSFQGDLSQFANGSGQPSPTYSTQSEGLPPSSSSSAHYHHHPHHYNGNGHNAPIPPNLRARSTTHLPSLMKQQQRHSTLTPPSNRRTTSTPGSESDRSAFRKSFIGGSVVNQLGAKEGLPPVPVDPKVLAKMSSRKSLKSSSSNDGGLRNASSRASIMSSNTDRTDALSTLSGTQEGGGGKKNKRKSWFARSPSSLGTATTDTLSSSSMNTSASTHSMLMGRSNTRQSTESSTTSSGGGRPPALSRASSSFGTNQSSPPPPTPPIPDTLPLPPSLGDKSRKSSTASLRQRVHHSNSGNNPPHSGASSPSPGLNEMMPSPHNRNGNGAISLNVGSAPGTPHSASSRLKTPPTPSAYNSPLQSPTNAPSGIQQANSILAATAPISSSPLSMSPMTSPTSASSHPLKPAALARPAALQLSTLEEHTMFPDSFPSPGTHHDALRRAEAEGLAASTKTARAQSYIPTQPTVTMSLPPTPITEVTPVDMNGGVSAGEDNALAPAAVIRPSPSSPPALGSLAAMANAERTKSMSPTGTPSSSSSRKGASPALSTRRGSRPNTPNNHPQHHTTPQQQKQQAQSHNNESISTIQAVNMATPRPSSRASADEDARSLYVSPPTSIASRASRKRSNNSLRATVSQAPPSPEPSSAIVEHVSAGNLLAEDDQFLPVGNAESSAPIHLPLAPMDKDEALPAPIPHQPELNTSLSSFGVRKAFPDHRNISALPLSPMPRKSSAQSILPESVPLPDSPALGGNGFEAAPMQAAQQAQAPLQARKLAPQPQLAPTNGPAKQLKPRASSPNLQSQKTESGKPSVNKLQNGRLPVPAGKEAGTPARKSTKSPFSLFKRSRSKTLGDGPTSPSEAAAAQLHAPPPSLPPTRKASLPYESMVPTGSPPAPASAQMTPAPTPQLSFSSSTTSTMAGSEPSDQFYADFAPASRPSFSKNDSSSSGNNTINANSTNTLNKGNLSKSTPSSSHHQHQTPSLKKQQNPSKSHNAPATPGKPGAFSRMFGASTKRKV